VRLCADRDGALPASRLRRRAAVQLFTLPKYAYAPVRPLRPEEVPPPPEDPEAGIIRRAVNAGPDPALAGTLPKAGAPELRYHQPELCSLLLKHVRAVNGDRLQQVKLSKARAIGSRQLDASQTLADLVQLGAESATLAPQAAVAVLEELATQTTYVF